MPQQSSPPSSPSTKTIEFEGQTHEFPADFSDADIQKALRTETTSTEITVPKGMIGEPESKDDSLIGGMIRRGKETVKGIVNILSDPLPLDRISEGMYEGGKQAAGQVKEQLKSASQTRGDPVQKGLGYARAGVTAASMLNPLATGPVTNINKLEDEGRSREALGAGTFDALTMLIGSRTGRAPSEASQVNKLAYATDSAPGALRDVLPELKETVAKAGAPKTVAQLLDRVQGTMTRLDQKFNSALAQTKGRIVPSAIADELEAKARSMPPSTDGQAMAKSLSKAAAQYRKPWTLQELNAERMMRNGYLKGFYGKGGSAQMAAMRSSADSIIDKVVVDGSRDLLYSEMDRQFPGQGFREIKQKQSALTDVLDSFDKHVDKLEKAQAQKEGAPFGDKTQITASAHPGGVTPRVHGLMDMIPGRGPMTKANSVVRKAFGPTKMATARRAAILSLPITTFVKSGTATLPPPPQQGQDEQGPQD